MKNQSEIVANFFYLVYLGSGFLFVVYLAVAYSARLEVSVGC